jgi:hypothetical protein
MVWCPTDFWNVNTLTINLQTKTHEPFYNKVETKINAHTHKNNSKIFGQIAPGKTHKGKTSEREIFIIFELRENFLLQ